MHMKQSSANLPMAQLLPYHDTGCLAAWAPYVIAHLAVEAAIAGNEKDS